MNADGRVPSRGRTGLIASLIVLTVLVLLPLFVTKGDRYLLAVRLGPFRSLGLVPISIGIMLGVWSAVLLITRGEGTPAPWNPPKRFVLAGPFQIVRNPMMGSVFLILLGEAVLAESLAILLYLCVVIGLVHWYVVTCEEKGLEARFGDAYRVYRERVPRWLPRLPRKG